MQELATLKPQQPHKKRAVEEEAAAPVVSSQNSTRRQTKNTDAMTKLVLANSQRIRALEGCVLETFKIKAEHPLTEALLLEGQKYYAQTQEQGKGHNLGSPSKYIWRALLRWVAQNSRSQDNQNIVINEYLNHWKEFTDGRNPTFSIQMRLCKVQKCFDKAFKKLILCVDLGPVADAARSAILATGATAFEGTAPAGNLERELQKTLK